MLNSTSGFSIELDRLSKSATALVEIALGAQRRGAAEIGRGVLAVEIDRLAEILDRVVEVALLAIGVAAIEIHGRQRGRLVLAGLDHDGASRDQRGLRHVLVQACRAFRDVLNGLRLRLWRLRLRLLGLRLRLTDLLAEARFCGGRPDRCCGAEIMAALLLSPRRRLRKAGAAWSRRPATSVAPLMTCRTPLIIFFRLFDP